MSINHARCADKCRQISSFSGSSGNPFLSTSFRFYYFLLKVKTEVSSKFVLTKSFKEYQVYFSKPPQSNYQIFICMKPFAFALRKVILVKNNHCYSAHWDTVQIWHAVLDGCRIVHDGYLGSFVGCREQNGKTVATSNYFSESFYFDESFVNTPDLGSFPCDHDHA